MNNFYKNFILKQINYPSTSHHVILLGEEFDNNKDTFNTTTSYILCSSPRSGSTLLCELLRNSSLAGIPFEYFNTVNIPLFFNRWAPKNFHDYLKILLKKRSGNNAIFGTKMHWSQLVNNFEFHLKKDISNKNSNVYELLNKFFPNLKFIFLTRNDKIKQAVSLWKAKRTQKWDSNPENYSSNKKNNLYYSFKGILRCLNSINYENDSWLTFFKNHNISPFIIEYENLVKDHKKAINSILSFLKIKTNRNLDFKNFTIKQQYDDLSKKWVDQFTKDLKLNNLN